MKKQILIAALFAGCTVFAQADFNAGWSVTQNGASIQAYNATWDWTNIPSDNSAGTKFQTTTVTALSGKSRSFNGRGVIRMGLGYAADDGSLGTQDGVYMTTIAGGTTYNSDTLFFTPCDIIATSPTTPTGLTKSFVANPFGANSVNASGGNTLSWTAPTLGAGQTLIGYRVQYRERGTQTWNDFGALTTNTSMLIPHQTHGLTAGKNYVWTVATRYDDNGTATTSGQACPVVMGIATNGNVSRKTDLTDDGAMQSASMVYPNPATDNLYIQTAVGSTVRVMDIQGRTIHSEVSNAAELNLNISDWTNGVYMVMIENNGELDTHKVVKH